MSEVPLHATMVVLCSRGKPYRETLGRHMPSISSNPCTRTVARLEGEGGCVGGLRTARVQCLRFRAAEPCSDRHVPFIDHAAQGEVPMLRWATGVPR